MEENVFEEISKISHLVPYSKNYKVEEFDCGIPEYNEFLLDEAEQLSNQGVTQTQLLINNYTGDIMGYFSLCSASIQLKEDEKGQHNMECVCFNSIPCIKIGKLAVDNKYREETKGIGSYLIQLVLGITDELNESIGCRFITVDADIENNKEVDQFYTKNDFVVNEKLKRSKSKTISMRLDVFQ
ncbi:N-acetyltransferase [Clostridium perfringens]|nr:N-acetyltransferase [Clostridium perfringens]